MAFPVFDDDPAAKVALIHDLIATFLQPPNALSAPHWTSAAALVEICGKRCGFVEHRSTV